MKIIIEEQDNGNAYLLTYVREGTGLHQAFGSLDSAKAFAANLTSGEFEEHNNGYGVKRWISKENK